MSSSGLWCRLINRYGHGRFCRHYIGVSSLAAQLTGSRSCGILEMKCPLITSLQKVAVQSDMIEEAQRRVDISAAIAGMHSRLLHHLTKSRQPGLTIDSGCGPGCWRKLGAWLAGYMKKTLTDYWQLQIVNSQPKLSSCQIISRPDRGCAAQYACIEWSLTGGAAVHGYRKRHYLPPQWDSRCLLES